MEKKITYLPLSKIKPYERNPRKNDEAVQYVANSIKEFGFQNPIIVDNDNVIIAGHTRYKAAKELKLKTVPVIVADELTDEQARAFRLADNKTAEKAGWDFDMLEQEILAITDIDLSALGFDPDMEFDIDGAFMDATEGKGKGEKQITCPECGAIFTP